MRFYEGDGWTRELLEPYLIRGALKTFPQDPIPYWVLEPHSRLDVERLVADGHVSEVRGQELWGELKGLSMIQVLHRRNW